jgi:hypothetical protein
MGEAPHKYEGKNQLDCSTPLTGTQASASICGLYAGSNGCTVIKYDKSAQTCSCCEASRSHEETGVLYDVFRTPLSYSCITSQPLDAIAWFRKGTANLKAMEWPNEKGGPAAKIGGAGAELVMEIGIHHRNYSLAFLKGTSDTHVDFGHIIKDNFTICSVTRYAGEHQGRILASNGEDGRSWLHGHDGGHAGVAYYENGDLTQEPYRLDANSSLKKNSDWVVLCGTNGGSKLMYFNGKGVPVSGGGVGNVSLAINRGKKSKDNSDFAVAEVLVWDRGLGEGELASVSRYLMQGLQANTAATSKPPFRMDAMASLASKEPRVLAAELTSLKSKVASLEAPKK